MWVVLNLKMLKEVDQNTDNMCSPSNTPDVVHRTHLAIHQTNVFKPRKYTITSITASPHNLYLAVRRAYLQHDDINHPFSQLDFYEIESKESPRHMQTIIVYEDIMGLTWLDERHIISVSRQATINLYAVHKGVQISTYTSDYGPITCMRYSLKDDLLITGTEYGYAVAYKLNPTANGVNIECQNKMVKLNESIHSIDFHLETKAIDPVREAPAAVDKKKTTTRVKKPGKRKRAESSDESDDEEEVSMQEDSSALDVFLARTNVTIYGACATKVVAWDYHRKTIVDTVIAENPVCSLLALDNGDFAIGDAEGYLNIYDKSTFTCRQSERVLRSRVTCLARDKENSMVIAAGKEPKIIMLKRKHSDADEHAVGNEYILQEHIKDHTDEITGALCTTKKVFFTCSQDNTIIKFRVKESKKRHRELKRYVVRENYRPKIQWNTNELALFQDKTLGIYKLDCDTTQFRSEIVSYPIQQTLGEPPRICSVKPGLFIHAAAIDDKWICYSTKQGIIIIDRPGLSRRGVPSQDLPACHILKLCHSGRYLVAGKRLTLTITELNDRPVADASTDDNPHAKGDDINGTSQPKTNGAPELPTHKTIKTIKMKAYIRCILYHEFSNRLIVCSGTNAFFISLYQLEPSTSQSDGKEEGQVKELCHMHLLRSPSSPVTLNYNDQTDTNIYIFTPKYQLLKCDFLASELTVDNANRKPVTGLPKGANILGIIILSRRIGLLYDTSCIYKLDMDANKIVNTTPKYDTINMVCDTIFSKQDEILIV